VASDKAFQDEINAFAKLDKKLGNVATAFQRPAGADAGFPDFGFTITLPSKKIDLHIEYKNAHTAQMGSMRDWIFDGQKFYTNDNKSEQKQELLAIMNNTSAAISNGKRLLADLKQYFSSEIKSIYSGAMTVIKDNVARKAAAQNFASKTKNYQIANIADRSLGDKILGHYKNKFKKSRNAGRAQGHMLIMMIKDEMWYVDTFGSVSAEDMKIIASYLGTSKLNKLGNLVAALEVRIQPRGLNSAKPASIDVMASYRLKGRPSGGTKVI
jgi:hypothetical protein